MIAVIEQDVSDVARAARINVIYLNIQIFVFVKYRKRDGMRKNTISFTKELRCIRMKIVYYFSVKRNGKEYIFTVKTKGFVVDDISIFKGLPKMFRTHKVRATIYGILLMIIFIIVSVIAYKHLSERK